MAMIETVRATPAPPTAPAADAAAPALAPASFGAGAGGLEDRLIAQVAFALAVEARAPAATPEAVEALRGQAAAALSDFAFRYLHNRVEEVRREAAAEATARARRPPGFATLLAANLLALALAAAAGMWIAANPDLVAGLLRAVGLGGH